MKLLQYIFIRSRPRGFSPLALGWVVIAPLLLVPFAGCRGEGAEGTEDLEVTLSIAPTPPVSGEARIVITVADRMGEPVDGAEVELEGNMTHAGMTPVSALASRDAPGRYVIPAFPFTMAGDWALTARVREAGELLAVHERRVRVAGADERSSPGSAGK